MLLLMIAVFLIGCLCALFATRKKYDINAGKRNIARIKFIQAEYGDDERWNHIL